MVITRAGFSQVVGNAFAGFGFAAEAPTVYEFPLQMMDAGSDLTPINENIDKIVYGLTKWQPKITTKGIKNPPKVTVIGKDYQDALTNMNLLFLKNMWADGLPLFPATEERVNWILTGTDLPRDTVVGAGKILPRGGIATVELLAVALAMAGGRPEYLPVLTGIVDAITDPACGLQGVNSTTCSLIHAMVVNGPIAKQIRLNSGYGCLGPDPVHSAGGSIGRAYRLMMLDMGGAIPGVGTMAIYGGPSRYTGLVFAEDEGGLPKGWDSLGVEWGFSKDANVVTVTPVNSMVNVVWFFGTKEENLGALNMLAMHMGYPDLNKWQLAYDPWKSKFPPAGIAMIPRGFAQSLASVSGYSKADIKTFLWKNSQTPWDVVVSTGAGVVNITKGGHPEGQPVPLTPKPEQITLVVAGGAQSGHGYWMSPAMFGWPASREITLPAKAKWDALLKQAEADLGPLPAM